jgi:hypothetical protein
MHETRERSGGAPPSAPRHKARIGHADEPPDDRLPPENPLDRGAGNDGPDERDELLLPLPKKPDDPEDPDELEEDRDDELLPNKPPAPEDPLFDELEDPDDDERDEDPNVEPDVPDEALPPLLDEPDEPDEPDEETRGGEVTPLDPALLPPGAAPVVPDEPEVGLVEDDPDPETRGGDEPPAEDVVPLFTPGRPDVPVDPVDPDDETRGGEVPAPPLVPGTPAMAGTSLPADPDTFGGAEASVLVSDPTLAGAPAAPRLPEAPGTRLRDSFFDASAGASVPWLRAVTAAPDPRSPARPTFLPVTWVVRCVRGAGSLLAFPPLTRTGGVDGVPVPPDEERSTMIGGSTMTVRGGS